MNQRFEISGAFTAIGGTAAFVIDQLNLWAGQYMQLITALSLVVGILSTIYLGWIKWMNIKEQRRERALKHKKMEHDILMAEIKYGRRSEDLSIAPEAFEELKDELTHDDKLDK